MPSSHERQVTLLAFAAGVPSLAVAMVLLWTGDFAARTQWTVTLVLVLCLLGFAIALRERVIRPLQTLSNMLAAIREQDYSLRARRSSPEDALGLAMLELNTLMNELRERRLGALEATALLRRVMAEIDVAVMAFDDLGALRLVNPGGERLLGQPAERLLGRRAGDLGLAPCLDGEAPRLVELDLAGEHGRWEMRRGTFRQGGRPHQFILLADVSRALREEERLAWQRLIRVLGHEINNSLTPIRSIADRLRDLLGRSPPDDALQSDLGHGLGVIASRSEGLSRFLASYTRLARLPPPRFSPVDVAAWVQRTVRLETRMDVTVIAGPDVTLEADGDQLDQLLINLIANAVDAALVTHGGVRVRWRHTGQLFELAVEDDGPGLPESANLFVPFFTTKPGGTGIGLVLSRQIAEGHGGRLVLANRPDSRGCTATLLIEGRATS
ncbi:MAG TPA: ATP-binding protein [Gemmatimonadales bacterium]|jgi:PAS domain S-box-containing protein